MPSARPKSAPALYNVPGGILSLSGPALLELLQAVLARGVALRFRARGFSMHPFIRDGDVLIVSTSRGRAPRPGDVLALCHPETGRLVVHRVLARRLQGLLIRGDNTPLSDGVVPAEKVLGRVTRVERQGRPVRLGQGPERKLIAWLARRGLLQPLIYAAGQVIRPFWQKAPA